MTEEFGPTDTSLTPFEQVAATSTKYLLAAVSSLTENESLRYDDTTATLSISGRSSSAGESFARGRLTALMLVANAVVPVGVLQLLNNPPLASGSLPMTVYVLVVLLPLAVFGIINGYGSVKLITKTNVIDHTTEPMPDLDDLDAQYLNDEIDEATLEAEKEARLE